MDFLKDAVPEVRAAAVFALGCLVRNRSVNNEHAAIVSVGDEMGGGGRSSSSDVFERINLQIESEVCDAITEQCTYDGSVLVRAELTVAIQW